MINVRFIIKNPKEGKNPIYLRVRAGRKLDLISTTREIADLSDWNSETGLLLESFKEFNNGKIKEKRDAQTKLRITENSACNLRLSLLKNKIESFYKESGQLDAKSLKSIIFPETTIVDVIDDNLLSYFDTFIESKGTNLSKRYRQKICAIAEILKRYIANRKLKRLSFLDVDNNFKNDFEKYCEDNEEYSVGYFHNNFKVIKTILFHAKSNGNQIFHGLDKIKCNTEKTMFVILTPEEQQRIQNFNFTDDHLDNARDWLIISCNSGQRVSDFMRFKTEMIKKEFIKENEKYFIEFIQEKTAKQIKLPLNNTIVQILHKRDWSFPRKMSEQRYNEHIKVICERVGITESVEGMLPISQIESLAKSSFKNPRRKIQGFYPKYQLVSSHIGRRSFASNHFGKIPTPLLMLATGHSTENMLMKYIGKIDVHLANSLAEYL